MVEKKVSAEIYELDAARARRDLVDVDPRNFVNVGAYLAAVREAAGVSVEAVSNQTHIKAQFIEAIESLDRKRLPAKPFAVGFAKSYAEALGLDGGAVADRFRIEAGYESSAAAAPDHHDDAKSDAARSRPTGLAQADVSAPDRVELSLLSVVAILAFVIWCALAVTRPGSGDGLGAAAPATPINANYDARAYDATVGRPPAPPELVETQILDRVDPVFPPRCVAGAMPVETVTVAFTVRVDGRVVSERVESASNPCFERAALSAIRQWSYRPRTIDGTPQAAFDQRATLTFRKPE